MGFAAISLRTVSSFSSKHETQILFEASKNGAGRKSFLDFGAGRYWDPFAEQQQHITFFIMACGLAFSKTTSTWIALRNLPRITSEDAEK